jgi:pyruvate kinase
MKEPTQHDQHTGFPFVIGSLHRKTSETTLRRCVANGMQGARIHLGKMSPKEADRLVELAHNLGAIVYVDTRGNKPNITMLQVRRGGSWGETDRMEIQPGDELLFYTEMPDDQGSLDRYHGLLKLTFIPSVMKQAVGQQLALDDGNILLKIVNITERHDTIVALVTQVDFVNTSEVDAIYQEGVSSLDIALHSGAETLLTGYDLEQLRGLSAQSKSLAERIGLSFVESRAQIVDAVRQLKGFGLGHAKVIAKIETLRGVEQIREIADCLMELYGDAAELWIARGDLGIAVQLPEAHGLSMAAAEHNIFEALKDHPIRVIVATSVAGSLRNLFKTNQHQPTRLTDEEREFIAKELAQGADGFLLASEMYAGPHNQGESADQVMTAFVDALKQVSAPPATRSSRNARP